MGTMETDLGKPLRWDPPGPGMWNLDRSHVNRPSTLINQYVQTVATVKGTRRGFIEIGAPLDGLDFRFVNGLVYTRIRPLVSPDKAATKLPPLPLLKVLMRIHPEMRRRAARAEKFLADRPWRDVLREWSREGGLRDQYEAANLAIQDVDIRALTDEELVAHFERVIAHATKLWEDHFWLHNFDLGPIGLLLDATAGWGIAAVDVFPLLEGASPSTSQAERTLRRIREAVEAVGVSPTSVDELRAVSPQVAADVDAFLRLRGRLVVSRYDVDGLTLAEAPNLLLNTILSARDDRSRAASAAAAVNSKISALRERVPEGDRGQFDMLMSEARAAMDLRDDNGPHTLEWPLGLTRLALLEVGRRMVEKGRLRQADHALELDRDEVADAVRGTGPGADVLAARQNWRLKVDIEDAPRRIGETEPAPPADVLPKAMAKVVGYIQRVIAEAGLDGEVKTQGLTGVGIGVSSYTGIARVAGSAEDALMQMEPGDVLVVPCTTPAYNMVLSMAGAVVTAEGGSLSHAAVLARELGIPAVVGAPSAIREIPDGATVEVDPVAGVVRVIG